MRKVRNISFENVTFDGGFWKERYDLNRFVSLESVYKRFEESGRFDALRFNYEQGKKPYPHIFFDSDVAKWIEAVGYLIVKNGGMEQQQRVIDALADDMERHRLENGYLNSHFIQIEPQNIFKNRGEHELYCAGHLIEAAVSYDKATGKHKLLNIMKDYVDCIEKAFITEKTAAFTTGGHEEIELALIKLYDYTGDKKYLDMAMFFLNERGKRSEPWSDIWNDVYDQSNLPTRRLEKAEGHAVRAVYLYTAMCEAYVRTGDEALLAACNKLFEDITTRKMYVTGGIGSAKLGEAFTVPYDLPNLEAYSESCAALGLELFALAMQQTAFDARYADVIERVMYNNMLSSTSLDGKAFFYENPLEIHLADVDKETHVYPEKRNHLPIRHRVEVFDCSCCPPNINRLFARVGDFFFSETGNSLVVNQYACLTLKTDRCELLAKTDYPADGKIEFTVKKCGYDKIYLRKPGWCETFVLDGADYRLHGDYIEISGKEGRFTLDFKMTPRLVRARPEVRCDCGRVALCYGPTVYCMERLDNPYELNSLTVIAGGEMKLVGAKEYLLPDITADGEADGQCDALYSVYDPRPTAVKLRFKPYWTFANRDECDMIVWVRVK